jgi:hypothetical protein
MNRDSPYSPSTREGRKEGSVQGRHREVEDVMHPLISTIRASSILLVHVNETGVLLLYGSRGLRVVHACLIVLCVAWADLAQSSSQSIADA